MNPYRRAALSAFGALLVSVSIGGAAFAAPPPAPAALSAADEALVARALAYLRALTSATGRFSQVDARGAASSGTFVLQRPGRARFDYDAPSGLIVASDGHLVQVVDHRLKTIQTFPLGATPLNLFLSRDIRLDRGVTVAQVEHRPDGFTIVARDARKPRAGQIALDFSDQPLALTGWTLTQAGGGQVRVRLSDFAPSPPRPERFFALYNPDYRNPT